jgi:hypothetical protein
MVSVNLHKTLLHYTGSGKVVCPNNVSFATALSANSNVAYFRDKNPWYAFVYHVYLSHLCPTSTRITTALCSLIVQSNPNIAPLFIDDSL